MVRLAADRVENLASGDEEYFMGSGLMTDVPLGERAIGAGGGGVVYLCQAREAACTSVQLASGASLSFTVSTPRRPLAAADWEREIQDRLLQMAPTPQDRVRLEGTYREAPRPASYPRIADAAADARGRLWLRTFERHGLATALWVVVDRNGGPQFTAVLPARFTPLDAGDGVLVGRLTDEDGTQTVQTFRMRLEE